MPAYADGFISTGSVSEISNGCFQRNWFGLDILDLLLTIQISAQSRTQHIAASRIFCSGITTTVIIFNLFSDRNYNGFNYPNTIKIYHGGSTGSNKKSNDTDECNRKRKYNCQQDDL
jgi:hypothetical protein